MSYKVKDPGNGQWRRYDVSDYARTALDTVRKDYPDICEGIDTDRFYQDYEQARDNALYGGRWNVSAEERLVIAVRASRGR